MLTHILSCLPVVDAREEVRSERQPLAAAALPLLPDMQGLVKELQRELTQLGFDADAVPRSTPNIAVAMPGPTSEGWNNCSCKA